MVRKVDWIVACGFAAALLSACAFDIVHVEQIPAQIQSGNESRKSFVLARPERFSLGSGFFRTLREGTKWEYVGSVQEGGVFRSRDQVFTVEASNIHEAYLVISDNRLVGFYLPVERTYSPLTKPIELTITTSETE